MTALLKVSARRGTCHMFLSGCRSVLMRFTIQLKSLPYRPLDMASLTSEALSTVLARMMVSPRVTTQCEVRASWSSSGLMQRTEAARREGEDNAGGGRHPLSSQPASHVPAFIQHQPCARLYLQNFRAKDKHVGP